MGTERGSPAAAGGPRSLSPRVRSWAHDLGSHPGPCLQKGLHSVCYPIIAVLKFIITCEEGNLCFHFAMDPTNCTTGLTDPSVPLHMLFPAWSTPPQRRQPPSAWRIPSFSLSSFLSFFLFLFLSSSLPSVNSC